MKATVCIPWRAQPDRVAAYERVRAFWATTDFTVVISNSDHKRPFHLAQARNWAVEKANDDVVIVTDADTIPDLGAVIRAVENIEDGIVNWPFDRYRHIPGSAVTARDLYNVAFDREYRNSVGGVFVTTQTTYWDQLGGQDERFEPRWGFEDTCFLLAATTLANVRREIATIYSFNHSADRDMSEDNPNFWRWQLYRQASMNPNMMRELLK